MCSKCYKDSVKRKNASPVSGRLSPLATTIAESTAEKVDSMTASLAQANLGEGWIIYFVCDVLKHGAVVI